MNKGTRKHQLHLTFVELRVLKILSESQQIHGHEIVKQSKETVKQGGVYANLERLEELQCAVSIREKFSPEKGRIPRRLYSITERGIFVLTAYETLDKTLDNALNY